MNYINAGDTRDGSREESAQRIRYDTGEMGSTSLIRLSRNESNVKGQKIRKRIGFTGFAETGPTCLVFFYFYFFLKILRV